MLTAKSRRLLYVLVTTALLCGAAVSASLGLERLRAARSTAALYTEQIRVLAGSIPVESMLLSQREELDTRLERVRSRFYDSGEMNPYVFGSLIKQELTDLGLEIARYQVVQMQGQDFLEFTLSGPTVAVVDFLQTVFESERYWTIPTLTINVRKGSEAVDAVFQVGYEEHDGQDS